MKKNLFVALLLMSCALIAGCYESKRASQPATAIPEATIDSSKYRVDTEPAQAVGVIDLRKQAKDGDDIVVVGRVGGSKRPVVQGRAAFTIVDLSLKGCDDDPNCYDFA